MKIGFLIEQLLSVPDTWNKGTEALVIDNILYVKGSDDIRDWLNSFTWGCDYYHFGYHSEAIILTHVLESEPIDLVVGHSAGAAIGNLIAYYLDVPSIGFGCPNFFSRDQLKEMANHFDNKSLNIDLALDVVPLVPFWLGRGNNTFLGTSYRPFEHRLKTYQDVFGEYQLEFDGTLPVIRGT